MELPRQGLAVVARAAFTAPGLARADSCAAMHQWYEAHRQQLRLADARLGLVDLDKLLGIARLAERDDHAAADLELIDQGQRGLDGRRGHDDAVVGRLRRPADPTVADDGGDIGDAELGEAPVRRLLQLAPALDGKTWRQRCDSTAAW